ncbi:MAG TPA: hypothetical protein VMA77_04735 [Solirubrobacteraceae bacterium]|nr:hypothetical protein [Solirubrobacteraceae bacterium]
MFTEACAQLPVGQIQSGRSVEVQSEGPGASALEQRGQALVYF